jgi:hypothetical protein
MRLLLCLSLSVLLLAALPACGSTSKRGGSSMPRSPNVSKVELLRSTCSSYFGGGVAVALCSDDGSQPLTITLHQEGARYGSSPVAAQAMGSPLHDGERFEIGPTLRGAELLARLDFGSAERLATGLFKLPPSTAGQRVRLHIGVDDDHVNAELRLSSGRRVRAARIYVPKRLQR